jgi:uncharacterized protein YkuJ
MRTYSGLLLFENLFDYIPPEVTDIHNLARSVLTPDLQIVEEDCGTTLGKFTNVSFELEGETELATGEIIDQARIETLLSHGIYEVATRHTSICVTSGGLCSKCYAATYPGTVAPEVNSRVTVIPEYLVNSEILITNSSTTQYPMITEQGSFDKTYAYRDGILLGEDDYFIEENIFTLTAPQDSDKTLVIKCVKFDTFPFIVWLANTFSGSIFGMDPLPHQQLPVRSLLLASLLDENRLQLISEHLSEITVIPASYLTYANTIKDTLEKSLFMLALYCTYYNATN